ncbi:unnamed protein product [Hermetia illucens]|uniref:Mitochondrial folate transporter/carrier n=1 Tax=Hermetia illucens TaxID=343691 RepID=A0A7R8YMW2_HERIL|nr:unnamed protein product [Hermetia illucens]
MIINYQLKKDTQMASPSNTKANKVHLLSHVKYEHLVAGISGGVTSTLILHPLDLIKIRFAVNDGRTTAAPKYRSLTSAFVTIFRQEGLRGLYKGVTPNVWGSGSAWGFYFMFYNTIKTWIQGGNTSTPLGPTLHMLAASEAASSMNAYRGMTDALVKIYRQEGIRGLYRGFVPGMFGVSHGALQFMTYEEMKNSYNNYRKLPIDTKLGTSEYLIFAAISKLIAAAVTYPYQVIRARLQDHHHTYEGAWDCMKKTWRYEQWKGFYKGIIPNLTRVVPATMITFVTYEHVSHELMAMK